MMIEEPEDRNAPIKEVGPDTLRVWRNIEALGLEKYVAELDVKGFTIVPPDVAGTLDIRDTLLDELLNVAERRMGTRPDMNGTINADKGPLGALLPYLLFEADVFQDLLMLPSILTLVTYLLGENACLSTSQAILKPAGGDDLYLHADQLTLSTPFPAHHQLCNVTVNLTDYGSIDDGPICFVPGSHKLFRQPLFGEAVKQRVPALTPRGSIIIFSGNTWHGAYARKSPGLRANMIMQFSRPHLRTFESYRENVTEEMLAKHPPRFATLMGQHITFGWKEEGPSREERAYNMGFHAYD